MELYIKFCVSVFLFSGLFERVDGTISRYVSLNALHLKWTSDITLTLCLPVSSAYYLGKQFRPGPDQGPNCLKF